MGARLFAGCGQAQRKGRSCALSHGTRIGIKLKRECYWVLFGVLVLLGATWSVGAAGCWSVGGTGCRAGGLGTSSDSKSEERKDERGAAERQARWAG